MLNYKLISNNMQMDELATAAAFKSLRGSTHKVCGSFKNNVHQVLDLTVLVNAMVVILMMKKNFDMNILEDNIA